MARILAGLFVASVIPHCVLAADWTYCIAPSHAEHKLYMSPIFATDGPVSSAESAFGYVLDQSNFRHDDVQCPRSDDESSAVNMQQQTISFNHKAGNTIVNLRWKPTR